MIDARDEVGRSPVGDYVDGYRIVSRVEGGTSDRPVTVQWMPAVAGTVIMLLCYLPGSAGAGPPGCG